MDPLLDRLAADAERARRLLTGVNDPRSIRTLTEIVDGAERRIAEVRGRPRSHGATAARLAQPAR